MTWRAICAVLLAAAPIAGCLSQAEVDAIHQRADNFSASIDALPGTSEQDVISRYGTPTETYGYADGSRLLSYRYREEEYIGDELYVDDCSIDIEIDGAGVVTSAQRGGFWAACLDGAKP